MGRENRATVQLAPRFGNIGYIAEFNFIPGYKDSLSIDGSPIYPCIVQHGYCWRSNFDWCYTWIFILATNCAGNPPFFCIVAFWKSILPVAFSYK
jgi:hypothetical protein